MACHQLKLLFWLSLSLLLAGYHCQSGPTTPATTTPYLGPQPPPSKRPKYKHCIDSHFCTRMRDFFLKRQDPVSPGFTYSVDPEQLQIYPETGEIYGTLVNSNTFKNGKTHYLRFKLQAYEGGILRMIVDDVNIVKHRRLRTSQHFGFETGLMATTGFTVIEEDEEKIVIEIVDRWREKVGGKWPLGEFLEDDSYYKSEGQDAQKIVYVV